MGRAAVRRRTDTLRDRRSRATIARWRASNRTMLWHHVRHSFRMIVREPAFSAAAVLTLALGVGANVAVFAVVESVLLRPLPYADGDEAR